MVCFYFNFVISGIMLHGGAWEESTFAIDTHG